MVETLSVQERLEEEPGLLYPPEAGTFLELLEMGRTDGISAWRSPAVERRDGSHIEGEGLFALQDIPANMLVAIKAGHVIDGFTLSYQQHVIKGSHQQIGPGRFLAGMTAQEVDENLVGYNHACEPNARIVLLQGASLAFLATREAVTKGEELTTDYSASQMTNTHFMICDCGSPACREIIAPLWDWEDPDFQTRYTAEFPWYMQDAVGEQQALGPEAIGTQRQFHELLKLAGGLRLLDRAILGLEATREGQLSGVLEEWQSAMAEEWGQTAEAAKLKRYEELRLKAAARFAVLYPLLGAADVGVSHGDFLPDVAIDRGEAMGALHERVEPHLGDITNLATDLAAKFNNEFER